MDSNNIYNSLVDLSLTLDCQSSDFNHNKTSSLQGVLMEIINTDYAEYLHQQGRKPYSQYLDLSGERAVWHICALSDDAYKNIIIPFMKNSLTQFELKHDDKTIGISEKHITSLSIDELFQKFYSETASSVFRIDFITPTAFKKNGKYSFYPEVYNIYQSLMKRFDEVSDRGNMFNQDTLDQLAEQTEVVGYSLHSTKFALEGVKIPAFMGSITIKIHGAQTMCNFAKLLLEFGEYSGVGIKTAIGMGSIQVNERRKDSNDRTRG